MSQSASAVNRQTGFPGTPSPTWWVVFTRELTDMWVGGKGLTLVIIYSVLLGLWSYVLASNTELRLIPPKEMVWEMLEASITVGCFLCLIAAAETISGDRERGALEALLLTPTRRRQLVMGKFLAVLSLWPAILAITIPYLAVLSQGTTALGAAALWGSFTGSVLVFAITAVGMLISLHSNSLKTSMFLALGTFIFIFLPFSLPGHAQSGPVGVMLNTVSPLMASYVFLAKLIVNNRSLTDPVRAVSGYPLVWHQMISPILFALLALVLLVLSSSRLRIEAARFRWPGSKTVGLLAALSVLGSAGAIDARAEEPTSPPAATSVAEAPPLSISIDRATAVVGQGDSILYKTSVTNHAATPSSPLTVAMNIINLDATGDIVDPEDWSAQRTQYIEGLQPGETVTLSWRANGVMDGDFMLYMVVIPRPGRPDETSQAVASSGIHLTISPRVKLNPKGILLYVIGTPLVLATGMLLIHRRRRRATGEAAGPAD